MRCVGFLAGSNSYVNNICGFLQGIVRQIFQQMLVLGFGETIPEGKSKMWLVAFTPLHPKNHFQFPVRRLQNSWEHSTSGQQSGTGLDGNVLLSRISHFKSRQIGHHNVPAVMDSSNMQRSPRSGVPSVEIK